MKQKNRIFSKYWITIFSGRTLVMLALVLTFVSCKKYLDDATLYTSLAPIQTAEDCQRLLDDYYIMNQNYPSDGQASSDDYYIKEDRYSQLNSSEDQDVYTWKQTAIRNEGGAQWTTPYHVVYIANLVLENIDKLKSKESDVTLNPIRGQALFFRAYALWNLVQLYAKPFIAATAGTDPGIPIRLSSDINGIVARSSVQDTYNQIISDLTTAAGLMPNTEKVSSRPSKSAAYAMLARVYLSMEDYPSALSNASAALTAKGDPNNSLLDYNTEVDPSSSTPFNRFNKEVLFHSVLTGNDLLSPDNPGAIINPSLYNSYDNNDLRKTIFFNANTMDVPDPNDPDNTIQVPDGTYYFKGDYEQNGGNNLFTGLTTAEVLLTRAECYARAGNGSLAFADLNTLLSKRYVSPYTNLSATGLNNDQVLARVLAERRKELVMRGQRWTDLRRLNKDLRFKTDLSRTINGVTYTLPANDLRYVLLIPRDAINNAKGILVQNAR